ncbi:MAG: hypothetical protein ACI870_000502 [Crocinitomicaceae bacterium]|jgi:hypothetical protein
MNIKQTKKNKGFVILFSMLISALILLISAGIFSVVKKEVVLSSYARESQRAFYSADSALECVLYADLIGVVATPTGPGTPFTITPSGKEQHTFECGGGTVFSEHLDDSNGTQGYEFPYVLRYYNSFDLGSCAYVLIEVNERNTDDTEIEIRMTAVGFNSCVNTAGEVSGLANIPDFNDPTLLERRLSITYIR